MNLGSSDQSQSAEGFQQFASRHGSSDSVSNIYSLSVVPQHERGIQESGPFGTLRQPTLGVLTCSLFSTEVSTGTLGTCSRRSWRRRSCLKSQQKICSPWRTATEAWSRRDGRGTKSHRAGRTPPFHRAEENQREPLENEGSLEAADRKDDPPVPKALSPETFQRRQN